MLQKGLIDMASKFFHDHHEFRADQSQLWWEIAQAAMAPGADGVRQLRTSLMLVFTIIRFVTLDQRGLPIAFGKFGRG